MSNFTEKHAELWKFIKFSLVGASSTLVEMGVFYLLQYVVFKSILHDPLPENAVLNLLKLTQGKGYLYAYIISTTIGYAIAFVLNRKTTFKADSNVALSTTLYVLMVVFTIFATAYLGTQFQLIMANHGYQALGDAIGKPLAAGIATVWTYPLNRFVIHRHKKTHD
ncbi:MAG: GtrA family protein [Oscillospiraceae bacterium]|jgi:putative flippase GtrA|nr:GtrA family protein [Ruminococcus sp.]MDD7338000.1 GtrA family protein [Ruminococcus sp.]MDY6061638.1 GtrA family protein [Oscillospiraceae bacterium]